MTPRAKPATIEAGKCYRLRDPFDGRRPGDRVVYVSAIAGDKQRAVAVTSTTLPDSTGTLYWPYSALMRRIWAEEPTAVS